MARSHQDYLLGSRPRTQPGRGNARVTEIVTNFSSVQGEGSLCSQGKQRLYVVGRISIEARMSRGKDSLELESQAEVARARMPTPEAFF